MGDEKIIIREDGGRLHAIINPTFDGTTPETMKDLPLSFISPGKYTYSFQGDFANFIFQFDEDGQSKAIVLNNNTYNRNFIEPRDGNTFKVELDKNIEEYISDALKAAPPEEKGDFRGPDLVDVTTVLDNVKLDVRYATTNNFLNAPTYSEAKSFLHRPAVMALNEANKQFNKMGYGILVHDAYRPWYVTKVFWDATEGDERNFVANPDKGSIHNRGSAIDLTLYELESGKVIKMVGTYDEMSERSYPDYMGGTALERWHRRLLRHVMEDSGFKVIYNEWWHFDHEDWQKYPILNQTFDELVR
jgi:D-alanyl-D-alanine dipeptidase